MKGIGNFFRYNKTAFIIHELITSYHPKETWYEYFDRLDNYTIDKILKRYNQLLIEYMICPNCYHDLSVADSMIETLHCHKCKWDTDSLNYTK
jgi:hypothetical protein